MAKKKAKSGSGTKSKLAEEAVADWSLDIAAHKALFNYLRRHHVFIDEVDFETAGTMLMSRTRLWRSLANPGIRRIYIRQRISAMLTELIPGHDLKPTAGQSPKAWADAYDAIEGLAQAGEENTIGDLGRKLDAQYVGWDNE